MTTDQFETIRQASASTIGSLFRQQARLHPRAIALETSDGERTTYAELDLRSDRAAVMLGGLGVDRGDRVAILSENRAEYLELALACAKRGAVLACQNWRLAPREIRHCIELVAPRVTVVSERHGSLLTQSAAEAGKVVVLGDDYEQRLARSENDERAIQAEPEDGILILYTSGTTGLPKGALISHRAELARSMVISADLQIPRTATALVWAPCYHMIATELALGTLLGGGKVIVVDGFQADLIACIVAREPIGYLALMPGTIEPLVAELEWQSVVPAGVQLCGAMADLVPAEQIQRVTSLLRAPYLNSFGSTETGAPPASAGVIPPGVLPTNLAKRQNSFCEVRLVDTEDREVPVGTPGELTFRGPTLFSGYWNALETNEKDFRGGWFHLGDVLVRHEDGTLSYVDRAKYMIKSGGENVYPAEIERVLMAEPGVLDAVVVRRRDATWGEIPVAVVAARDGTAKREDLLARCRSELAGFKQPKDIVYVKLEQLPRSTTGKIQRHEVESWLAKQTGGGRVAPEPRDRRG